MIICILLLISSLNIYQAVAKTSSSPKPLLFQFRVSHQRNVDHISLVFRGDKLQLITNTSSYQKSKTPSLGVFEINMNPDLKDLEQKLQAYYKELSSTISMLDFINKEGIKLRKSIDPHAPIIQINEEKIEDDDIKFGQLMPIIQNIWEHKWECMECATYSKKENRIIRTIKKPKQGEQEVVKTFSKQQLRCYDKPDKQVECVDPQFGIFEI